MERRTMSSDEGDLASREGLHERLLRLRHFLVESDHFSFVNKYLPWRYPLGSLAMAALAAALCGWFVNVQAFTLLVGMAAVVVLGLVWPWLSVRAVRGQLAFEQSRGVEGRAVTARLTVTNYLPLGAWGLSLYGGSEGWAGQESVVNLAMIPGWRTTQFSFPFVPPARGEYPMGRAALGTGFPFGLWEARRELHTDGRLIAWPASFDLHAIPEAAASDRTREGMVYQNRSGHAGDLFGVRAYARGDSLRRIHWPQTAKLGELMICERQASASVSLQIVVDADEAVHGGLGPSGSREWVIRAAASLAETFLDRGGLVELLVGDVVIPVGGGRRQRLRVLDGLAKVPAHGVAPLERLLTSSAALRFSSGLQIVLTTDLGATGLPAALFRRRSMHLIIFRARAFDPGVESCAGSEMLPSQTWFEITSAVDVPSSFCRAWREVLHAN
jgi:uncharacterized protein (DUF58 family)